MQMVQLNQVKKTINSMADMERDTLLDQCAWRWQCDYFEV